MTTQPLDLDEAAELDEIDPLTKLRDEFEIPKRSDGSDQSYFAGTSLGLLPKRTRLAIQEAVDQWGSKGVTGHFDGEEAWYQLDESIADLQKNIVGCHTSETGIMGSLTTNLHMLMASFYRPEGKKRKILIEPHAFPSDRYAVAAQVEWHGGDPRNDVVTIEAENPDSITPEDLDRTLQDQGNTICLALLGGVNYYTGQFLDIATFAPLLKAKEITIGLDLAHAVGNVPLELHEWGVDFASWCTYKYLNAGPGSIAGYFVHQQHHENQDLIRLAGWWGNDPSTRFDMHGQSDFIPRPSADSWKTSCPSLLAMVPLKASLDMFAEYGMDRLRERSIRLTNYFEKGINAITNISSITPKEHERRGCQISVRVSGSASTLEQKLVNQGIVPDARDPDILRFAPVPMYSTFSDIAIGIEGLSQLLQN